MGIICGQIVFTGLILIYIKKFNGASKKAKSRLFKVHITLLVLFFIGMLDGFPHSNDPFYLIAIQQLVTYLILAIPTDLYLRYSRTKASSNIESNQS